MSGTPVVEVDFNRVARNRQTEPVFFFCCSVSFVVGSLKDEPGRRVSE